MLNWEGLQYNVHSAPEMQYWDGVVWKLSEGKRGVINISHCQQCFLLSAAEPFVGELWRHNAASLYFYIPFFFYFLQDKYYMYN